MNAQQIMNVMRHFEIPSCWHRAFCRLVIDSKIDDRRFGRFVRRDREFKAAFGMMMEILSADSIRGLFPDDVPALEQALAVAGA